MLKKLRQGQKGFTLIELLIVIAIIGIIAALLIPNFIDALQKGKQKRTMGDMKSVGTAMFSLATDMAQGAAAGADVVMSSYGSVITAANLAAGTGTNPPLVSQYIQTIPALDGWKTNYEYYFQATASQNLMAIRSGGRNKGFSGDTYSTTNFEPTDYDQDIVWADGFFVRWPQKLQ